jgi:hypothetical protein
VEIDGCGGVYSAGGVFASSARSRVVDGEGRARTSHRWEMARRTSRPSYRGGSGRGFHTKNPSKHGIHSDGFRSAESELGTGGRRRTRLTRGTDSLRLRERGSWACCTEEPREGGRHGLHGWKWKEAGLSFFPSRKRDRVPLFFSKPFQMHFQKLLNPF